MINFGVSTITSFEGVPVNGNSCRAKSYRKVREMLVKGDLRLPNSNTLVEEFMKTRRLPVTDFGMAMDYFVSSTKRPCRNFAHMMSFNKAKNWKCSACGESHTLKPNVDISL